MTDVNPISVIIRIWPNKSAKNLFKQSKQKETKNVLKNKSMITRIVSENNIVAFKTKI